VPQFAKLHGAVGQTLTCQTVRRADVPLAQNTERGTLAYVVLLPLAGDTRLCAVSTRSSDWNSSVGFREMGNVVGKVCMPRDHATSTGALPYGSYAQRYKTLCAMSNNGSS
jgi:hypothetical protein